MAILKRYEDKRTWRGLYDSKAWQSLRRQQLNAQPLCVFCQLQGLITAAAIVDHIRPHKGNEELFFNADNLQSLCKLHHDSSKQKSEKTGLIIGADYSGLPIDLNHHWHK